MMKKLTSRRLPIILEQKWVDSPYWLTNLIGHVVNIWTFKIITSVDHQPNKAFHIIKRDCRWPGLGGPSPPLPPSHRLAFKNVRTRFFKQAWQWSSLARFDVLYLWLPRCMLHSSRACTEGEERDSGYMQLFEEMGSPFHDETCIKNGTKGWCHRHIYERRFWMATTS